MKKSTKILLIYFIIECFIPLVGNTFNAVFNPEIKMIPEIDGPADLKFDGGPSQPEVQTFQPVGTTELVDPFTGDFSYNIPLLDVGGYPINMFYNSGVTMEEEASWVGLGWNLNPGVINRNVRGLPDDFDGDTITKEYTTKPNKTWGITLSPFELEIFGGHIPVSTKISTNLSINYNNYLGYGLEVSIDPSISAGSKFKGALGANLGVGSERGAFMEPSANVSYHWFNNNENNLWGLKGSLGISSSVDSKEGWKSLHINSSYKAAYKSIGLSNKSSSHLDFTNPTYTPSIQTPMTGFGFSGSFTFGTEAFGLNPNVDLKGYYSYQEVAEKVSLLPSFGYIYLQHCNNENGLMDFNRENDGIYRPENPDLPLTNLTNDIYNVSGQGVSGSFRAFRGDVGTVSDNHLKSISNPKADIGVEIGVGNAVKWGVDLAGTNTKVSSGKWMEGNQSGQLLRFYDKDSESPSYEPVYFKNMGETTVMSNPSVYDSLGGNNACEILLDEPTHQTSLQFVNNEKNNLKLSFQNISSHKKLKREHRSTLFTYLNGDEAQSLGFENYIISHQTNYFGPEIYDFSNFSTEKIIENRSDLILKKRNDEFRKPHHISEVTVTKDEGTRYIYGIPVYNIFKKEVSFNVSPTFKIRSEGNQNSPTGGIDTNNCINYNYVTRTEADNSLNNSRGCSHYYNSVTTPAYAYAYLLTAIVSQDYIDLTGDGLTSDDFGTYTKFNYSKVCDNYKWREPYQQGKASYQEGNVSDPQDDMGNYVYGEKEIYYLHSIETKNYIAEFTISPRVDGIETRNENGGMNVSSSQHLYKLKKIELYAKVERMMLQDKAIPIKTVHFEYDYSLCPGFPSNYSSQVKDADGFINQKGKLTLKKIYFTYEKSKKGIYNPYIFSYGYNPGYDPKAIDRWANYKPNDTSDTANNNSHFPYTMQHKSKADLYSAAWLLDAIHLPTGASMKIDYEADDYAYVQDKRAMQMFQLKGITGFNKTGTDNLEGKNSFVFELNKPLAAKDPSLYEYVRGINELYFNCKVNIKNNSTDYESIKGFIAIDPTIHLDDIISLTGERNSEGKFSYAKINYSLVSINDDNSSGDMVNPVSKASWQFIRLFLSRYSRDMNVCPDEEDATEMFVTLAKQIDVLFEHANSYNGKMRSDGIGKNIVLPKSFIRLNNPDKIKIGGGVRVKRITINDQWGNMQNPIDPSQNFTYGTEYDYSTTEVFNGATERIISSGVAAFEPIVGGEENPLVIPDRYRIEKIGVLDDDLYRLEPYGQSFFPAPVIGYSKVRIRNIKRDNVTHNATGSTVSEFYTSKDFPVIVQRTDPRYYRDYLNLGEQLLLKLNPFFFLNHDNVNTNQGYVIELNNMHGKLKKQSVFSETDSINPISFVEYRYKKDHSFWQKDTYVSRLDNHAIVMDTDGKLSNASIGIDYDFVADARYESDNSTTVQAQLNCDMSFYGPFPVPVFMGWPYFAEENTTFKSQVLTKLIYRTGIIDTVIAYDLGSTVTTTNLVYDAVTGLPLITKSGNEFNDAYYSYNIPAHHVYNRMGPAYQNIGIEFSNDLTIDASSRIRILHASEFFVKGDELLVERQNLPENHLGYEHAWVDSVLLDNNISVIKEDGSNLTPGNLKKIKIIRSGRRNMQNNSVGQIVMKHNPIPVEINSNSKLEIDSVIDSQTTEYNDHWQTYTAFNVQIPQSTCNCTEGNYPNQLTSKLKTLIPLINGQRMDGYEGTLNGCIYSIKYKRERDIKDTACCISLEFKKGPEFPGPVISFSDLHYLRKDKNSCPRFIYDFYVIVHYGKPQSEYVDTLFGKSTCLYAATCAEADLPSLYVCNQHSGDNVNPFRLGLLGNFRPLKSWMYLTDRTSITDMNKSGIYNDFSPFWNIDTTPSADKDKWTFTQKNSIIDPFGKVLQTEDALNRPSADLYGYNHNFVIASTKNSYYRQIAFDGFEDYDFENRKTDTNECKMPEHFKFESVTLTDGESHTGKHSVVLNPTVPVSITRGIYSMENTTVAESIHYKIHPEDFIGIFEPDPGEYFFSAWVKCPSQSDKFQYENISVKIVAGSNEISFLPQGKIIDGWQQVSGTFIIDKAAAGSSIKISLLNNSASKIYFDDIRVQPFNSSMQTYVYDPQNLRLMATLDENNFATLYEYDEEGQLTRTKKETEEGVMTIQEVRAANPKTPSH